MRDMVKKVEEIAYHRNGVAGEGFHVVKFVGPERRRMLAVVFKDDMHTAVFERSQLPECIAFAQNSWRGDDYDPELRQAIAAWDQD